MTMTFTAPRVLRTVLLSGIAACAVAAFPLDPAFAAGQGNGKQAGGQQMGSGQGGGQNMGGGHGQGGRSLSAIFRDVTGEDVDEDSDRPDWAGVKGGKAGAGAKPDSASDKRGDLYGDLWVILRDDNGVPILTPEGFVQPLDAEGNTIPLDDEGAPIDATLVQEVDMGRLSVGRAPTKVLDTRADEVVALLNSATEISLDPAGRLVITAPDENGDLVTSTIDSPLENLAIYVALLTEGTIPGVSDLPGDSFDFMVDGTYTVEDLAAAASFLAAATDKTSPFTADEIAYIDAFLGINLEEKGDVIYSVIDYQNFSYDRSDTYGDTTATVLVQQDDGSWVSQEVNIYDAVFGSTDLTASGTLDAYTQAAEDSREVVEFLHEYAVPVDQVTSN